MKRFLGCAAALGLVWAAPALAETTPVPGTPAHPSAPAALPTILHAGKLLAVPGEKVVEQATVVTRDGKILAVRSGYLDAAALGLPADTAVVDLKDRFVLPGFMDMHVHLSSGGSARNPMTRLKEGPEYFAINAYANGYRTLMAGFTTVRDLGSPGDSLFALRDAIRDGIVAGPKIIAAGEGISPTNGHADAHGLRRDLMEAQIRPGVCDGADDCRRAVRNAIKYGADVIKVHVTGGVLDESDAGTGQQFTDEELRAIVDAGHAMGRKVTTHAHGKSGIDAAVRAGYDSIEHAMWADEESLKLMKQKGTWLIPTVWPISWVGDTPEKVRQGPFKNLAPNSLAKLYQLGDQPKKMVRAAIRLGVPIALGTDNGIAPHGTNGYEMLEYVEAGMTPMEALKTGTVNAAKAGGVNDRGSIAPGLAADIIALEGDPLTDIRAVLSVDFVMRDGIIFKKDGKAGETGL
ncbi:MAG: amidohydrolase family protein [Rhizorhabdus sp.]|jgi:imidazolonepropionase-like amidohydrolase|uniref:metal-dependent hydrolase family protein n=1 Tax=Rhizorhabdus sp. TaxID=1968843 RepID=UPI001B603821|nr:amidohydrolase family protein [Rhizorhabdus sp.]MBP8232574.1 amidohydrolase family protein [Rhizorhabdus sp.]